MSERLCPVRTEPRDRESGRSSSRPAWQRRLAVSAVELALAATSRYSIRIGSTAESSLAFPRRCRIPIIDGFAWSSSTRPNWSNWRPTIRLVLTWRCRGASRSGIEHVPIVAKYPPQRRELAVEHPPLEVIPGTEILDADLVFGSLRGSKRAFPHGI